MPSSRAELPPLDLEPRTLLRERGLDGDVSEAMYLRGDYDPRWSTGDPPLTCTVEATAEGVLVTYRATRAGVPVFDKRYHFRTGGSLDVEYRWNPAALRGVTVFAPEVSYAGPLEITVTPSAPIWSYDIVTVAKSEKAMEQTVQGRAVTPLWPVELERGQIEIRTQGRG